MENSAGASGSSLKKNNTNEALNLNPAPEALAKAGLFKHIVTMTVKILKVPIALIVFTEEECVKRYAVGPGLDNRRKEGFNSSAILLEEVPFLSMNSNQSLLLLADPLVASTKGFSFYAAAPLMGSEGAPLGTICVIGRKPREFPENDQFLLEELAAVAVQELEERWIRC